MRLHPVLLVWALAAWASPALAEGSGELFLSGLSLNNVTKSYKPGQRVHFESSAPGPDGTFQLRLQLRNVGSKTVVVQSLLTAVYLEANDSSANNESEPLLTLPVQDVLPSLQPGQFWPSGGAPVPIPLRSLPVLASCEPWNLTLAINSTSIVTGAVVNRTSQQDLIPISISAKCSAANMNATTDSGPLTVAITTPEQYMQTDSTQIPVMISFGTRLMEQNPLKLFNISGTDHVDIVYALDDGDLYLMLYVQDPAASTPILVEVPAGVAISATGTVNGYTSMQLYYQPEASGWKATANALSGILAGTAVASWGTSFVVSCIRPTSSAGSLGYGMLGHFFWAQKFFLTGLLGTPQLPAAYRTAANAFRWTDFHIRRPWVTTESHVQTNTAFQLFSVIEVDQNNDLIFFDGDGPATVYLTSPSPGGSNNNSSSQESPGTWGGGARSQGGQGTWGGSGASSTGSREAEGTWSGSGAKGSGSGSSGTSGSASQESPGTWGSSSASAGSGSRASGSSGSQEAPGTWAPGSSGSGAGGAGSGSSGGGSGQESAGTWGNEASSSGASLTEAGSSGPQEAQGTWVSGSSMGEGETFNDYPSGASPVQAPASAPPTAEGSPGAAASPSGTGDKVNASKESQEQTSINIIEQILGGKKRRLLSQQGSSRTLLQGSDQNYVPIVSGNTRYVLASTGVPPSNSSDVIYLTGPSAWAQASAIISQADPSEDKYSTLLDVAFWGGGVFLVVCLFSGAGILAVRWLKTEMPGVLYVPRMQLMVLMLALTALTQAGSCLFSEGLAPMFVGLGVFICFPVTFLLLAYLACTEPLYRKEKAVYLVSKRSKNVGLAGNPHLLRALGMEEYRGNWRPADPVSSNCFVFRWGPLFEDCRGPPYTYRRLKAQPTLERKDSVGSEASDIDCEKSDNGSSIVRMADPPKLSCGPHSMHRSVFQLHGVLVSLARMVCYALVIGSLSSQPKLQAVLLLLASMAYLVYLRLVVPYSRLGDMAVEYWDALLDILIFTLALAVSSSSGSNVESVGRGMLALQIMGFLAYLANRGSAVAVAWRTIIWPVCLKPWRHGAGAQEAQQAGVPEAVAEARESGVLATVQATIPGHADGKHGTEVGGMEDDLDAGGEIVTDDLKGPSVVRVHVTACPAILEEPDSQAGTPLAALTPMHQQVDSQPASPEAFSKYAITLPFSGVLVQDPASPRAQPGPSTSAKHGGGAPTWVHPIIMRLGRDASGGLVDGGDCAPTLWDRFWRSL